MSLTLFLSFFSNQQLKVFFFYPVKLSIIEYFFFKVRVHVFFIREMDVPPLGESNLMGPKKSVEVKFFTVAFFGVSNVINDVGHTLFSCFV